MPFYCPQDRLSESDLRGNSKKAIFRSRVSMDGTSFTHYAIVTGLGIKIWFCLTQNKTSLVLIENGTQTKQSNLSDLPNSVTHWLTSDSQAWLEPATADSKSFLAHQCWIWVFCGENLSLAVFRGTPDCPQTSPAPCEQGEMNLLLRQSSTVIYTLTHEFGLEAESLFCGESLAADPEGRECSSTHSRAHAASPGSVACLLALQSSHQILPLNEGL